MPTLLVAHRRRRNRTDRKAPPVPAITDQQILAHQPLVRHVAHWAKKKAPYPVELDDLIQVGWCGFLAGLQRYDPSRNVSLGAFCSLWVRGAIHRHIWKQRALWENGRGQIYHHRDPETGEPLEIGPESPAERDSLRMILSDLLESLPEREAGIVRALYLDEVKPAEVARRHGMLLADVLQVAGEALAWLRIVGE